MIRTLHGLAEQMERLDVSKVLERFASDKKHTMSAYTLILVAGDGQVVLEQIARSAELDGRIRGAIETTIERYCG